MPKRKNAQKPKLPENKEELLISHVRQYPVLYTIKNERYYDTKFKAGIWQTIAGLLEEEKDLVQSSWDSIKAKYKREKKKVEEAARIKETYEPHWNHYSSLKFLDEAYVPHTTVSNLDGLFTEKSVTAETMDKSTLALIQSMISPAKQGSSGSSQLNENQPGTRANSGNEDSIFFNSLLDHVKKVPDDKKLAMRNEIQNIITKYAYPKPAEAERCCGALDYPTMGNRHATANVQQTSGPIKTERMQKKVKVEVDYDTDDSDCEYVGHVVPMKKIVSRDNKRKTSKKQDQALLANTSPLLQVDPSQQLLQQLVLQQQQQYQMFQNLCTFGIRPTSAAAGGPGITSKAALDGNQKSSNTDDPGDEVVKDS